MITGEQSRVSDSDQQLLPADGGIPFGAERIIDGTLAVGYIGNAACGLSSVAGDGSTGSNDYDNIFRASMYTTDLEDAASLN